MTDPDKKDPKPSEILTEPVPEGPTLDEIEDRMFDYLYNGTVDGEVFDGDPADLDFF